MPRTPLKMFFFLIYQRKEVHYGCNNRPAGDGNKAAWFIEKSHAIYLMFNLDLLEMNLTAVTHAAV
jgi:hypothetical protein